VLSAAKDYYYQVQMQIACTGAKEGLLMFFNPRFLGTFNEHRAIHPILIPRDEEVIEDIRISIMGGIAHLNFLKRRFALTK
jgi:hypothetical protein